jgi:hypothetical protein
MPDLGVRILGYRRADPFRAAAALASRLCLSLP